ncbi:AN1-type domain-containing protein [Aphelenchoides bicaudatus]|nr:AN1-type domain-containing protein [Aphelenchoides bicaudatus]
MAEFPGLGQHCAYIECGQLDFLPIKCYGCSKMFCSGHFTYEAHSCESGLRSSVQVPICPLCSQVTNNSTFKHFNFYSPFQSPKMNPLISLLASTSTMTVNQIQLEKSVLMLINVPLKRCKGRELVKITCDKCRRNFCIKHRHFDDHNCCGLKPNPELRPLTATNAKSSPSPPAQRIQSDEEIARALQNMLNDDSAQYTPEEMDRRLAEQLQREEYNSNQIHIGGETATRRNATCCIS